MVRMNERALTAQHCQQCGQSTSRLLAPLGTCSIAFFEMVLVNQLRSRTISRILQAVQPIITYKTRGIMLRALYKHIVGHILSLSAADRKRRNTYLENLVCPEDVGNHSRG